MQDEADDLLTYALLSGPESLSIDSESGLLTWTPAAADLGITHDVQIEVTDTRGGSATQQFQLEVLADAPNNAPVISSAAPTVARVGLPLFYDVVAEDQNSDPLTYELINGPAGAEIEDNQLVWTPDSSELGQVRELSLIHISEPTRPY